MSEPQEVPAVLTDVAAAALALALAVQLARREGHGWSLIGAFMGLPADRAEAWFGTLNPRLRLRHGPGPWGAYN